MTATFDNFDQPEAPAAPPLPASAPPDEASGARPTFDNFDEPHPAVGTASAVAPQPDPVALRRTMDAVGGIDSATEAKLRQTAKLAGVPVEVLRGAPSATMQQASSARDWDALARTNPTVASFLTDPGNAAVAKDHIDELTGVEREMAQFGAVGDAAGADTIVGGLRGMLRQMFGGSMMAAGEGPVAAAEAASRALTPFLRALQVSGEGGQQAEQAALHAPAPDVGMQPLRTLGSEGQALYEAGAQDIQKGRPENPVGAFVYDVATNLVPLGVGAAVGTVFPPAALPTVAGLFGGQYYGQSRVEEGLPVGQSMQRGALFGASEFVLEAPVLKLLRTPAEAVATSTGIPAAVKTFLSSNAIKATGVALAEGVEEGLTQAVQDAYDNAQNIGKPQTFGEVMSDVFYNFLVGAGMGAAGAGMHALHAREEQRLGNKIIEAQQAQGDAQTALRLADLIRASKLATAAPDVMQSFLQSAQQAGIENVSIEGEAFGKLAEKLNITPDDLAHRMGASPGAVERAVMTTGYVDVPFANFAASEHAPELIPVTRLRGSGMSEAEAKEYLKTDAGKELAATLDAQKPGTEQVVHNEVRAQMQQAGFTTREADAWAQVVRAHYRQFGQLTGRDPLELWKEENVQLRRVIDLPEDAGALKQGEASQPIFYSALTRAVESSKQGKATADQWLGTLKNLPGIKQEEIEQTELADWLKEQTGSVTREAVLEHLHENAVQVQEVMKGANSKEYTHEELSAMYAEKFGKKAPMGWDRNLLRRELGLGAEGGPTTTKFASYQLPGGENYRELLLTLPPTQVNLPQWKVIRPDGHVDSTYASEESARVQAGRRGEGYTVEQGTTKQLEGGFRSSHFDEPNILAHVRFNDRTDADGKKVLFIEEVQSDWGQKGRREGYSRALTKTEQAEWDRLSKLDTSKITEEERANGRRLAEKMDGGVPDMPFKQSWPMLAMRRMLRYAAENGYDKVAWTTGTQQADRYDLSKQLSRIAYNAPDGWRAKKFGPVLKAFDKSGHEVINQSVDPKDLPDHIGKEAAQKLIDSEPKDGAHEISGLDLKVGGEGMKAFYDRELPNEVNKYVKKWGGKVGEAKVSGVYEVRISSKGTWYVVDVAAKSANMAQSGVAGPFKTEAEAQTKLDELGGAKVHVLTVTPAIRDAVLAGQPLFQQSRGQISFGPTGKVDIAIFETGNISTVVHEFGHLWVEQLRRYAVKPGATPEVKAMWASMKEFGDQPTLADDAPIPREMHEKLAEGFETYFQEGKAPSNELRRVFTSFKTWLMRIYRALGGSGTKINAGIRAVFDRLLASEDEIAAAQRDSGLMEHMFTTAADMGVPERVFDAYRKLIGRSRTKAKEDMDNKVLGDVRREREQWWQDESDEMREHVEKEAREIARFQVVRWLKTGETPNGVPLGEHGLLSGEKLKALYPDSPEILRALRNRRLYSAEDGIDPEIAANVFGYQNVSQMVDDITGNAPEALWVDQEVERRMKLRHGDYLAQTDRMNDAALSAVHNDLTGDVLAAELRALRAKQREVGKVRSAEQTVEAQQAREALSSVPSTQAFRAAAAARVGQMTLRDVNPRAYLNAEQLAGRKALAAMGKKDFTEAAAQKQRQLLNHFMFTESVKAREEMKKLLAFAKRLQGEGMQRRLGLAGGDYQEAANAILEQYEFAPVSGKQIDRRTALREWADKHAAEGEAVAVPDSVLNDSRVTNYKQVPIDELRGIRDALDNIVHLARLKNGLQDGARRVAFDTARQELLSTLATSYTKAKPRPIDPNAISKLRRVGDSIAWADAGLLKTEQLLRWMDGDAIDGPWQRLIFRPIAEAQTKEQQLTLTHLGALQKLLTEFTKGKDSTDLMERRFVQGVNDELTNGGRLAVALNAGNESNYQRLRDGFGWTDTQVRAVLDTLSDREWQFVHDVWQSIGTIYPEAAAMEKRLTGLEPVKIQPWANTSGLGQYLAGKFPAGVIEGKIGGYVPVVYNPELSVVGERQISTEGGASFFGRASTSRGYTKERAAKMSKGLLLDFVQTLPQHIAEVSHDIAYREAVQQANRILNNDEIAKAIRERVGVEYHRAMDGWLRRVAGDRVVDDRGARWWTQLANGARVNFAIVSMGFKATTALNNFANYSIALDDKALKAGHLATALKLWSRNPIDNFRAGVNADSLTHSVFEKSGEMRYRARNLEMNMRDAIRKAAGKNTWKAKMQAHVFDAAVITDRMVSVTTWYAHYLGSLDAGLSEGDAVAGADSHVRLTQGAAGAKDLASVQTNELMKLINPFYGFFSVMYSRLRDVGHAKAVGRDGFATVAWRSVVLVLVAGALSELLSGRPPKKDEDWWLWLLNVMGSQAVGTVPVARAAYDAAISGRDAETPMTVAIDKVAQAARNDWLASTGEKDFTSSVLWSNVDAAGLIFGLPTGQAKITGKYIWDLWSGDAEPETPVDFLHDILFTRPREK